MAIYKYVFNENENENDWQVAEKRWGGEAEAHLFNHFDPDPNAYYIPAESYQEAEEWRQKPVEGLEAEAAAATTTVTLDEVLNISRYSKLLDQKNEVQRDGVELRNERLTEIEQALSEYQRIPASEEVELVTVNRRDAVALEVYDINHFSTNFRTGDDKGYQEIEPVELRASFMRQAWEAEQGDWQIMGLKPVNQGYIEQYAQRQSRDEILMEEVRIPEIQEAISNEKGYEAYDEQQLVELEGERSINVYLRSTQKPQEELDEWER